MATQQRRRPARAPQTPQNSTQLGVILVVVAVVVALLLFTVGGGSDSSDDDLTAADQVQQGATTTSTPEVETVTTTPPAALKLVVANGSSVKGRAGATAERFNGLGYAASAVDGTSTATTVIYYVEGMEADGVAVAGVMGFGPDRTALMPAAQPLQTPDPAAQVIVLIGPDFDPGTAAWGAATATN
ncbi:MAG TPA: LytR C-terminal domain-containing protein [Microthrixaceae bacterium]|nr:MAG: LytR family transcriptional regulator [Mycobacterium sp.]HPB44515.1 LytR C-terminal domain-containing protein [Microthrixaceae bacterium]